MANCSCLQATDLSGEYCALSNLEHCCRGSCSEDIVSCSGPCLSTSSCSMEGPCPSNSFCRMQALCEGHDGIANCTNLQISRAGYYTLTFQFSGCSPPSFAPSACQQTTRVFQVTSLAEGVMSLSLSCFKCQAPLPKFDNQPFEVVTQALDRLGNLITDGVVSVAICDLPNCPSPLPALHFVNGVFNSNINSKTISTALQGPLSVNISGGFAYFINLSIAIPFSSVQLIFKSGAKTVISSPITISARNSSAIRLRQQPSVWKAGSVALFQSFIVNGNGYVVESESTAQISAQILTGPGSALNCAGGWASSACAVQIFRNGSANFSFVFSSAGQYVIRFRSTLSVVDSAPFFITNSNPASIFIVQQPTSVSSGYSFLPSPTVVLADVFGNWISSRLFFGLNANCDEIFQQLWCDSQICAGSTSSGQCCVQNLSLNQNNAYRCTELQSGRYHLINANISCYGRQSSCQKPLILSGSKIFFSQGLVSLDGLFPYSAVNTVAQLVLSSNLSGINLINTSNPFNVSSSSIWIFTVEPPSFPSCVSAGLTLGGIGSAQAIACRICTDMSQCSSQTKAGTELCPLESRINTVLIANIVWISGACSASLLTTEECKTGPFQADCGSSKTCNFTNLIIHPVGQFVMTVQATYFSSSLSSTGAICIFPSDPAALQVIRQPNASSVAGELIKPAPVLAAVDEFGNILSSLQSCASACYSPPAMLVSVKLMITQSNGIRSSCSDKCGFLNQNLTIDLDGMVTFPVLSILRASQLGESYSLYFELNSTIANVTSAPFVVIHNDIRHLSVGFINGALEVGDSAVIVAGHTSIARTDLTDQFGNLAICCCGLRFVAARNSTYLRACNFSKYALQANSTVIVNSTFSTSEFPNISEQMQAPFNMGFAEHSLTVTSAGTHFFMYACYSIASMSCSLRNRSSFFNVASNNGSKLSLSFANLNAPFVSAGVRLNTNVELHDFWGNRVSDSTSLLPNFSEGAQSGLYHEFVNPNSSLEIVISTDAGCQCAPHVQLVQGVAAFSVSIEVAGNASLFVCPVKTISSCSYCIINALQLLINHSDCGNFQGGSLSLTIYPLNTSNITLVVQNCTSDSSGHNVRILGSINCTFKLIEKFGNEISLENALRFEKEIRNISAQYLNSSDLIYAYNPDPKKSFSVQWELYLSKLIIRIPANSSTFVSPFQEPSKNRILSIRVNSERVSSVTRSTIFNVINGPIIRIALGENILETPAGGLLQLDPSGVNLSIRLLDASNSLVSDTSSNFTVHITLQVPYTPIVSSSFTASQGIIRVAVSDFTAPNLTNMYQLLIVVTPSPSNLGTSPAQWILNEAFVVVSGDAYSVYIKYFPLCVVAYETLSPYPEVSIKDRFGNLYSYAIRVFVILSPLHDSSLHGTTSVLYNASSSTAIFSDLVIYSSTYGKHEMIFYFCQLRPIVCVPDDVLYPAKYLNPFVLKRVSRLRLLNQAGVQNLVPSLSQFRRVEQFRTLEPIPVLVLDQDDKIINCSNSTVSVTTRHGDNPIDLIASGQTILPLNFLGEVSFTDLSFGLPATNVMLYFHLNTFQNFSNRSEAFNIESINVTHLNVSLIGGSLVSNLPNIVSLPAGSLFTVAVKLLDFDYNLQSSATRIVEIGVNRIPALVSSADILEGKKTTSSVNGNAVFSNLSLKVASPYSADECIGNLDLCLTKGVFALNVSCPGSSGYLFGQPDQSYTVPFIIEHGDPSQLGILVQPGAMFSDNVMIPNPKVVLQDAYGNTAIRLFPTVYPGLKYYYVRVSLRAPAPYILNASIGGNVDHNYPVNGIVQFTDLRVSGPNYEEYSLVFNLILANMDRTPTNITNIRSTFFAIRSFKQLMIVRQPSDPCYFGALIDPAPVIAAVDSAGKLVPSAFTIFVSSTELNLTGSLSVVSEQGIATFSNVKMPPYNAALYSDLIRYRLNFSTLSTGVPSIFTDEFSILQGTENEFQIYSEPTYLQAQNEPFKNVVLQLRDSVGHLVNSGQSARADLLFCSSCETSSAASCVCQNVNDRLYGDGLLDENENLILCSQVSSGYVAFSQIVVNVPDDNYFLKFTRFGDDQCSKLYPIEGLGVQYVFSSKIRVTSYAPIQYLNLNLSSCPSSGSIFMAGQPIHPQPQILGIYDMNSKPAYVLGSEIKAILYMKPTAVWNVACSPFNISVVDTRECFPFEGYGMLNHTAEVNAQTATAQFRGLSITTSSDGQESIGNRTFYIRFIANSFISSKGFIGNIAYADCPDGFYVSSGNATNLKINVQPSDNVAGSIFDLSIDVVDSFGNMIDSINNTWVEAVLSPNASSIQEMSWNQRYIGNEEFFLNNFSTRVIDGHALFGLTASETIRVDLSANSYRFVLSTRISNDLTISAESLVFNVVPSVLQEMTLLPVQYLSVSSNDSICGSNGSAWEEIGTSFSRFAYQTSDKVSVVNLLGDSVEGLRCSLKNFYNGSEIVLFEPGSDFSYVPAGSSASVWAKTSGVLGWGEILEHDYVNGNTTINWIVSPLLNLSLSGFKFVIIYSDEQVRAQNHRCVIKLQDSFGNLIDNLPDLIVHVKVLVTDPEMKPVSIKLLGVTSSEAVGGLVTFPNIRMVIPGHYRLQFEVAGSIDVKQQETTANVSASVILDVINQPRHQILIEQQPKSNLLASIDQYTTKVNLVDIFGNPVVFGDCFQVTAILKNGITSTFLQAGNVSDGIYNFSKLGTFAADEDISIAFMSGCCGTFGPNTSCHCLDVRQRSGNMSALSAVPAPCVISETHPFNSVLSPSKILVYDFPMPILLSVGVPIFVNVSLVDAHGHFVNVEQGVEAILKQRYCVWIQNMTATICFALNVSQTSLAVLGNENVQLPSLSAATSGNPSMNGSVCDFSLQQSQPVTIEGKFPDFNRYSLGCGYTLTLYLAAYSGISWTSSEFVVTAGQYSSLQFLQSPASIQKAGNMFWPKPIVYLEDRFGNAVYVDGVSIVVKRSLGPWFEYKQSICFDQVCDFDATSGKAIVLGPNSLGCAGDQLDRTAGCCNTCSCDCCCSEINRPDLFCGNIQDVGSGYGTLTESAKTLNSCFEACELDPTCVGITFYSGFEDWSVFNYDNVPRYQCFKAYTKCNVVQSVDPSSPSVYIFSFIEGELSANTVSGKALFNLIAYTAGRYTLTFCFADDSLCQHGLKSPDIVVVGADVIEIEVIQPNIIESQLQSLHVNGNFSSNFVSDESFSLAVRVKDNFGNTVTQASNFSIYVRLEQSYLSSVLAGIQSAWVDSGVAYFTDLIIVGGYGTYALDFSAEIGSGSVLRTVTGVGVVNISKAVSSLEINNFEVLKMFGGEPLPSIVNVKLLDSSGNIANLSKLSVYVYSPIIIGAGSCSDPLNTKYRLIGSTYKAAQNGIASFTDLGVGALDSKTLTADVIMLCFAAKTSSGLIQAGPVKMFTGPVCFPGADSLKFVSQPVPDPDLGVVKFYAGLTFPEIVLEVLNYPTGIGGWPSSGSISICSDENSDGILRSRRAVVAVLTNTTSCNPYSKSCLQDHGGYLLGNSRAIADLGQPSLIRFTDLAVNTAGSYMIDFISQISGGVNLSISFTFRVLSVQQNTIPSIYLQPGSGISSIRLPPVILVFEDTFGNVAENVTMSLEARIDKNTAAVGITCWNYRSVFQYPISQISPNPLCGQLLTQFDPQDRIGSITVKAVAGVASFHCLSIDKIGVNYTLIFSFGPETSPFSIIAGEPTNVSIIVQPALTIIAGTQFLESQTPLLELHDRMGNGISIDFPNSSVVAFVPTAIAEDLENALVDCVYHCLARWPPLLMGVVSPEIRKGRISFPYIYITRAVPDLWLDFHVTINNKTFTTSSSNFSIVANPLARGILIQSTPNSTLQGERFEPNPVVYLLDIFGNLLTTSSYLVIPSLIRSPCIADSFGDIFSFGLMGTTSEKSFNGVAIFKDLFTLAPGGLYCLRFDVFAFMNLNLKQSVLNVSSPFRIISRPVAARIIPGSWEVCSSIFSNSTCSEYCTWSRSEGKCLGLEDTSTGSVLIQQPKITLIDINGLVVAATGYYVNVSLTEGITGYFLTGKMLQNCLHGTLSSQTGRGVAQFSDLKLMCEGQGYRLNFTIDERLGLPPVISSAFGVHGKPFKLTVIDQPQNGTVNHTLNIVRVEVRDTANNIFSGPGNILATLEGVEPSKCPERSKTLLVGDGGAQAIWGKYSNGFGILYSSFVTLIQDELNLQSSETNLMSVFEFFDVEGSFTVDGIPIPNGVLEYDEFQRATSLCACGPGEGAGNFTVNSLGAPVIYLANACQPLQSCRSDHLGLPCRRAQSQVPHYLDRLEPLQGKTVAPIIGGIAEFSYLKILDCAESFSLSFQFFDITTRSNQFSIFPGPPSETAFRNPLQSATFVAGSLLEINIVILDSFGNFQPQSAGDLTLIHPNVSAFSSNCSIILPCDSCPDGVNQCPGPLCPFRCDYGNILNTSSVDQGPLGHQVCMYRCKLGCSFMCGTMNQNIQGGMVYFNDVKIKRIGVHSLGMIVSNVVQDTSRVFDWTTWKGVQLQILRNLLLTNLDYSPMNPVVSFNIQPSKPFFLVSDFRVYLQQTSESETRAGEEIFPYPTCLITDLYGNLASEIQRRVGLFIRDSDRDEFDMNLASAKFPTATFTAPPSISEFSTTDDGGCAATGEPTGGCPLKDNSVRALLDRSQTISYEWCPSNSENRFCRTCTTADRAFAAYNQTFWEQTYEYVNDSLLLQLQGGFDCPGRLVCDVDSNCGCLTQLFNASGERNFDLCEACSTRSLPNGLPVSYSEGGIARFLNITCRNPRKGYRLFCISPPEGSNTEVLASVSLDIKNLRKPPQSFVQDSTWGQFTARRKLAWEDGSGNAHPQAALCNYTCVNHTFEAEKDYSNLKINYYPAELAYQKEHCPAKCWQYGYPVYRNPIFNYVIPESPGLSFPFSVVVGKVVSLLTQFPIASSSVSAEDTLLSDSLPISSFYPFCTESNASCGPPTFHLLDKFNNINTTSSGAGLVELIPGPFSHGSTLGGTTGILIHFGQAVFLNLRINCVALGNKLRFRYRPWPYKTDGSDVGSGDVVGESVAFNVLPAPPRLLSLILDTSWTRIRFIFDKSTNLGNLADFFNCTDLILQVSIPKNSNSDIAGDDRLRSFGTIEQLFGAGSFCSWENESSLILQTGWNASWSLSDQIFLKNIPIRAVQGFPDPVFGSQLASLPITYSTESVYFQVWAAPNVSNSSSCLRNYCSPQTILENDQLVPQQFSCASSSPSISKATVCLSEIYGTNVQDVAFFFMLGVPFLAVGSFCDGNGECESFLLSRSVVVYEMASSFSSEGKSRGFFELQSFAAAGVVDVEGYQIFNDKASATAYIAIVQYYDGSSYQKSVDIYGYEILTSMFQLVQSIPTHGARKVKSDFFATSNYLIIAQEYDDNLLMKWIPGYFFFDTQTSSSRWQPSTYVQVSSFLTGGSSNIRAIWSSGTWIIAFSNYFNRSVVTNRTFSNLDDGRNVRSSADIFISGFTLEIKFFVEAQDEESANITLLNQDDTKLAFLKPGVEIILNNETMVIMNGSTDKGLLTVSLSAICLDRLGNPCSAKKICTCVAGSKYQQTCLNSSSCRRNDLGSLLYVGPEYVLDSAGLPNLQLPSTGGTDLELMKIGDTDFVVVANQFSGCDTTGFECDSIIYQVNYSTGIFSRYQRVLTNGVASLLLYPQMSSDENGFIQQKLYLFIANLRSSASYVTDSKIFRWVSSSPSVNLSARCGENGCTSSQQTDNARFEQSVQLQATGSVQWLHLLLSPDEEFFLLVSSRSDASLLSSIYSFKFSSLRPTPLPYISSFIGKVAK